MKKIQQTFLSKIGFNDSELKTPVHDEMCLYFSKNAVDIINSCYPEIKLIKLNEYWVCKHCNKQFRKRQEDMEYKVINTINNKLMCCKKKPIIKKIKNNKKFMDFYSEWECSVCNKRHKEDTGYCAEKDYKKHIKIEELSWEHVIKSGSYTLGFVDFYVGIGSTYGGQKIVVEIKPEIKSIGEVMRQMKFYKSNFDKNTKFILITKTKGLKELFKTQGIEVFEYKDEQKILSEVR